MYGVPESLDLRGLQGARLYQVTWREHSVEFVFYSVQVPLWTINVEGGWELRDGSGVIIDRSMENSDRRAFYAGLNIGKAIVDTRLNPPQWFELEFDDGTVLRVLDDSTEYESFSIQPGDIYV